MRRHLLLFLFLQFAMVASSQTANMSVWLNTGNDQQRAERLVALGVEPDVAKPAAEARAQLQAKWVPLKSATTSALLFLPCNLDSAFLHLLTRVNGEWRVVDRMKFDCHYDGSVSVEATTVRSNDIAEVFVHHACEGHGTGFLQQNFSVIDVVNRKLKVVLDTEEVVDVSRVPVGSYELLQRSTFTVVPSPGRVGMIAETRSVTLNGRLSVQRRYFHWSATKLRYTASKFNAVYAQAR